MNRTLRHRLNALLLLMLVALAPAWASEYVPPPGAWAHKRSEEHTSELQSLMRISSAVFCLKQKNNNTLITTMYTQYCRPYITTHDTTTSITQSTTIEHS